MGRDIFFAFENVPAWHIFKWLVGGGQTAIDIDRLIKKTLEGVRGDGLLKRGSMRLDRARENLAARLRKALLLDLWHSGGTRLGLDLTDADPFNVNVDASTDSLWEPILAHALCQIDFKAIADALLIWTGKQDTEPLEIKRPKPRD
jgi:hypothetical protein